jgi:hypothetical protein
MDCKQNGFCAYKRLYEDLIPLYDKLTTEILGDGYYNYGCTAMQHNHLSYEDSLSRVKRMKREICILRVLFVVALAVIVAMILR